jgi:hypothetical protein
MACVLGHEDFLAWRAQADPEQVGLDALHFRVKRGHLGFVESAEGRCSRARNLKAWEACGEPFG